ncbi:MAG TPA: hypothetical protein VNA14_13600 [Mycobacteriales bacterium]|nr:hypothetical protein [Mycobacteriales bacterium]
MRRRLYAVVAVAALGLAMPSHAEDPKKLDGGKTKKIEAKAMAAMQSHDDEQLPVSHPDRMKCAPPRCLRFDFIFAPVAGVTGDLVVHSTWGNRLTDVDLYLADDAGKQVASCAFTGGTGEIFAVPADKLVKGKKYTVIADFFRSVGEEVTASVEYPAAYKASGTTPYDWMDCALDG